MNTSESIKEVIEVVEDLVGRGIDVIESGWDIQNSEPFIVIHVSEKGKNHVLPEKLPNGTKISYRYEDVADFAGK